MHASHPLFNTSSVFTNAPPAAFSPDNVQSEIKTLSRTIQAEHEQDVLNIACLIHMTRKAFAHYELLNDTNLSPVIALQQRYLSAWKKLHGIDPDDVGLAVSALKQAECSIRHIEALDALDSVDVFLQLIPSTAWTDRFAARPPPAHTALKHPIVKDVRPRPRKSQPRDPWLLANKEFLRSRLSLS